MLQTSRTMHVQSKSVWWSQSWNTPELEGHTQSVTKCVIKKHSLEGICCLGVVLRRGLCFKNADSIRYRSDFHSITLECRRVEYRRKMGYQDADTMPALECWRLYLDQAVPWLEEDGPRAVNTNATRGSEEFVSTLELAFFGSVHQHRLVYMLDRDSCYISAQFGSAYIVYQGDETIDR